MTRARELEVLAAKVKQLTGPDREVDGAIDRLLHKRPKHGDFDEGERAFWRVTNGYSGLLETPSGWARDSFCAARYTASLDAAMSLVPEGHNWAVEHTPEGSGAWCYDKECNNTGPSLAATPALALTAAALRALASDQQP